MILFLLLQRRVLRFMRLFAICSGALSPGKFECIGQGRSAWCTKAELSCTLIQNTKEAPPWNLCITSAWTCTSGRSATA
jgi:hypothetical protein